MTATVMHGYIYEMDADPPRARLWVAGREGPVEGVVSRERAEAAGLSEFQEFVFFQDDTGNGIVPLETDTPNADCAPWLDDAEDYAPDKPLTEGDIQLDTGIFHE